MKHVDGFKIFSLSLVWVWLIVFAFIPFCLVLLASFLSHNENHLVTLPFTIYNYLGLNDSLYFQIFARSFLLAGVCSFFCLILGYPFAYIISRLSEGAKNILVLLIMIPFWTSSLIRSYALIAILKAKGLLNVFLLWLGLIDLPLPILFTNTAVIIGLVYNLLPFMVLPILTNIERLDTRLIDAARDLGATRFTIFRRIVLPLTMPGIVAGCTLVFLPAMTIFYIPDILGGAKSVLVGNLIQREFLVMHNWPEGAAVSIVLTTLLALLVLFYRKTSAGSGGQEFL
jgi:spermidine/putrescine transport system permease protein